MVLGAQHLIHRRQFVGTAELRDATGRTVAVLEIAEVGRVVEVVFAAHGVIAGLDLANRRGVTRRARSRRGGGLGRGTGFFECGVLDELLGDLFLEVELRQLQQLDRLLKLGSDDELLNQPGLELLFQLRHETPYPVGIRAAGTGPERRSVFA